MRNPCTAAFKKGLSASLFFCSVQFSSFGQAVQAEIIDGNARPSVFLQEGVSVPNQESAPSFTPDGKTVYFSDNNSIRYSKLVNGKWSTASLVSFSGHWKDWDAALSPDGQHMVFVSNRPLVDSPQDKPQKNNQLWYCDHLSGTNWSTPRHLGQPVNIDGANDYGPSISGKGTLCFCSRRDGKGMKGYSCRWVGDHYEQPVLLALNGDKDVFDPFIAPDERYIIFASEKKLWISYRNINEWAAGQVLGPQVNNGGWNGGPYVSPDGKMLYYSSSLVNGILMIPIKI